MSYAIARPHADEHQSVAAVVMPLRTPPCSLKITPPQIKPIPEMIWAEIRVISVAVE